MKTKTRYSFSYGTAGKRKSGNLSSVSSVYYADGNTLGLNKGHYCVPIRKNGNGTYDVVTLTSISISKEKYSHLKKSHWVEADYIPIKVNGVLHYVNKSKLSMIMKGIINPLPVGKTAPWKGIDVRVIQNVDLSDIVAKTHVTLNL